MKAERHDDASSKACRQAQRQEAHPQVDTRQEEKETLWGYGSGVASATVAGYGDVVLAEWTQPFNENDQTYFVPLSIRTVGALGFFPTHITAFDAWYSYQTVALRGGIAAIALNTHGHPETKYDHIVPWLWDDLNGLNTHGHPETKYDPDGTPLCAKGLRMHPTLQFAHTNGFLARRFRCPLLFPLPTGETCEHAQFAKAKGCVKDPNWEKGGLMRALLKREGPLYRVIYNQRTACERINSQSEALGIKRPKVRNGSSVRNLNTLTYLVINARALQRVRQVNATLLTDLVHKVA